MYVNSATEAPGLCALNLWLYDGIKKKKRQKVSGGRGVNE